MSGGPEQRPPEIKAPEDLIPAERQQRLQDWIEANMGGSIQELVRVFGASPSTIRRDLDAMATRGLVRRTHGGAVALRTRTTAEATSTAAAQTAVEEKQAIAALAVQQLEPQQSVMLDTGSTMLPLAQAIAALPFPLTVITNDLQMAGVLSNSPTVRLLVPGGICRPRAYTLLGEPGLSVLRDLRCDRLFLTAQALDGDCVSDTHLELVTLKRTMIASARATSLLIDSSRIGSRALHSVTGLGALDEIITDEGLSDAEAAPLLAAGVPLRRAALPDNGFPAE